ncbi:MAG: hypothetical protein AAF492_12360, partial [Verrucomicrobiota bacterium]
MKNRIPTLSRSLIICGCIGCAAVIYSQGPLTPPGPPSPTMKTLLEVEPRTQIAALPFTINTPGSFYLAESLTGVSGQNGITVNARDVTLDLNGFSLVGVAGSLNGLVVPSRQHNIVVANGSFRDWDLSGLNMTNALNSRITEVRCFGNGAIGLNVGPGSLVSDCLAVSNQLSGFELGENINLDHCMALGNGAHGFRFDHYNAFTHCRASDNAQNGFNGLNGNTFHHCLSKGNQNGFELENANTLKDCSAVANLASGIF